MFLSTEDLELSSRVSRFQTGPPLKRETDGKLMPTLDKPGIMPWLTWVLNGLQCNSGERDKNQTLLNGSDLSNSVRELPQDFSTMRCHTQPGWDTTVISITQRRTSTHSPMPIKTNKLFSVLTPPPRKEELNSRLSLMLSTPLLQRSSGKKILHSHMRWTRSFQPSHITRESSKFIESTPSRTLWPRLLRMVRFHQAMLTPLKSSSEPRAPSLFHPTFLPRLD